MLFLWDLNCLCCLLFAFRVGKDYWNQKNSFRLFILLVFVVFNLGSVCMEWLYFMHMEQNDSVVEWIWGGMTISEFILLVPVFTKYFYLIIASRGGFFIESGIVLMCIGTMASTTKLFEMLPVISLISAAAVFLGYDWLQNMHKQL